MKSNVFPHGHIVIANTENDKIEDSGNNRDNDPVFQISDLWFREEFLAMNDYQVNPILDITIIAENNEPYITLFLCCSTVAIECTKHVPASLRNEGAAWLDVGKGGIFGVLFGRGWDKSETKHLT